MAFLPAALPFIALGTQVLGTGASALASSNAAQFQAHLAEQQGRMAQDQASIKAAEVARNTRQTLAAGRAGAAQNGFELTGSMTDLLDQTARQGELDYLTAVYDGSVQKAGSAATAANFRRQGTNALISGGIGAASQALGGYSRMIDRKTAAINITGT